MDQKNRESVKERQARYRKSQREAGVDGLRQIGPYVKAVSYWNLKSLAKHRGISQGEVLDDLIGKEYHKVINNMSQEERDRF